MRLLALALGLAVAPCIAFAQPAQTPIKIGFISTFSGPEGAIGKDLQDGYNLALEQLGGKLAGRPVETVWGDDQTKPDIGRQLADKMIESDKVQLLTGVNFSNVLLALIKPTLDANIPYVSVNAAPSQLAGKGCQPLFFAPSHQNDALFEAVGDYMQAQKIPSVYMIAPNYPAGRDMLTGFKRRYKGEIKGEVYTAFPAMDFAAQIAEIRAKKPAAVMFFLPGGMTVNFIKQYMSAGLKDIPLYTGQGSVDALTLPALGESAAGVTVISNWVPGVPLDESKAFEAAFEKKYNRVPSTYAAIAYDVTHMLDSALKAIGGKIEDRKAFRVAMEGAKFNSLREGFSMNTNHFAIQDMYRAVVEKDPEGRWVSLYKDIAVERIKDSYYQDCHMPE